MTFKTTTTSGHVIKVSGEDRGLAISFEWTIDRHGYAVARELGEVIKLHREVYLKVCKLNGETPLPVVDHINHDRLDNRRENLRGVTKQQNDYNRKHTGGKHGYKGVTKDRKRFKAQIMINQKKQHVGSFDTPEEAARAYDEAAKRLFGEHAYLNFPEEHA